MLHYITAADPAASGRGIKNHNKVNGKYLKFYLLIFINFDKKLCLKKRKKV